jgi:hypothetical protein
MKLLLGKVTLPLLMQPEADRVKRAFRALHDDVHFDFSSDISARKPKVAINAAEDRLEAEVDRVGLVFRRLEFERELESLIEQAKTGE